MFKNRQEAGQLLSSQLNIYQNQPHVIVLGLARGGAVTAAEVAKCLQLPFNVVVPRKIGMPGNPEVAIGSIMEDGDGVFDESIIKLFHIPDSYIKETIEHEKNLAKQRLDLYRQYIPLPILQDQTVLLIDDGMATGLTMLTVIQSMRKAQVKRIIVAIPVASSEAFQLVKTQVDELYCLYMSDNFRAVGLYYEEFEQITDEKVVNLFK